MEGYEYANDEKRTTINGYGTYHTQKTDSSLGIGKETPYKVISNEQDLGVTVRTVREFFKQYNEIQKLEEQDKMSFFVSMYQIYNESVFDLLNVP